MTISIKHNPSSVNALRHLSNAQNALNSSLERLSSGERINQGADDPAGLIISENLKGQIAGLQQAIKNSEFSVSMIQTAEGALTEVNNLLIDIRQLSLAAANEGANDTNSLLALQAQLQDAIETIDRVSTNTEFSGKKLLDGSRGTSGVTSNEHLAYLTATPQTRTSPVEGYEVNLTQVASAASITSSLNDDQAEELEVTLQEGKSSVTVVGGEDETAASFASKLREAITRTGLHLSVAYNQGAEQLQIQHESVGTEHSFRITSNKAEVFVDKPGGEVEIHNGTDVKGTIGGEPATGRGAILVGNLGNRNTSGLAVAAFSKEVGGQGKVSVLQNALVFQVGANQDQNVSLTLDSTSSSALGRYTPNDSGFTSLSDNDITTGRGAQNALRLIDSAINQVSFTRGKLGSFQKHSLESNIATLQITTENLIAAESTLRDTDIASELAEFTKNKILNESAAASVAQAGEINRNSLLRLLREQ